MKTKVMKRTVAALVSALVAGFTVSASAQILGGLDTWDSTTAPSVPVTAADISAGVTASATNLGAAVNWSIADSGADPGRGSSDDTTWGTYDGGGTPASSVTTNGTANFTLTNAKEYGQVTLSITNNGSSDFVLANFHFDALAFRPKAARTWIVNVLPGSDITVGNVYTSGLPMNDNSTDAITHLGGGLSGHNQHDDIDQDLTGLADHTLAAGEVAIIQLVFTNGVGDNAGGHHLFLDNVGIAGNAVAPNLVWLGDGGADAWDTGGTALNWTNITDSLGPVAYSDPDNVIFDDTSANTTVNIGGTVAPTSITVSNDVNNYTFSGGTLGGGSLTKQGSGGLTLSSVTPIYGGGTAIEAGTLTVSSATDLALVSLSGSGDLVKAGAGTLTLSGANSHSGSATVQAGTLAINNNASGSASYQVDASTTLALTEATANSTLSMSSLTFAGGSTSLTIDDGVNGATAALISAPNLTNSGTVTVNYSATNLLPGSIVLIDYEAASSTLGNWSLASLPAGITGAIVTNVANSSIDLQITDIPSKIWAGTDATFPDLWDILTTANWDSGTATYSDGDAVRFDDTGATTTVNVNNFGPVAPSLMWVTNNSKTYKFDNGPIATQNLIKEGTGTATLTAFGNSFTNIDLRAGTLSYEIFGGTETATMTGAGTLSVGGSFTSLTLNGNMSGFDGPINVLADNTLTLGANNQLGNANGATTIASGAQLEINGKSTRGVQVIVSGDGTFGSGVLQNSGGLVTAAFDHVTLAGNASIGGLARWDIRAVSNTLGGTNNATLDTTGGSFALTKKTANDIRFNSVNISTSISSITVEEGGFFLEMLTTLANPATPVTVNSGATFGVGANGLPSTPTFSAALTLNEGTLFRKTGGQAEVIFAGTVTLNGIATNRVDGGGGATLTVTGPVSGVGGLTKETAGNTILAGTNTYTGATTVSAGTLVISTASSGSSSHTVNAGATLGALRSSAGDALPLTSLTLGAASTNTVTLRFDLVGFDGSPTTPVMDVSGGTLTANAGTNNIRVTADTGTLTAGTKALLKYPAGTFTNTVTLVGAMPGGADVTVTNNTTANQVELIVAPSITTDPAPTLSTTVVGTDYVLDWFSATNSYEGYTLQSQTNSLSIGLSTNWMDITGTESGTSHTQAINPADPTVFFRLIYTP